MKSFGKSTSFGSPSSVFKKVEKDEIPSKKPTYSRKDMELVNESKNIEKWAEYAKSKGEWKVEEEPFEFDQELRCSVSEKIQVLRKRENEHFKKLLQERKQRELKEAVDPLAVLDPIFERGMKDPKFLENFVKDVEKRSGESKSKFCDQACQVEVTVKPTEDVGIQTEQLGFFGIEEKDGNDTEDHEENINQNNQEDEDKYEKDIDYDDDNEDGYENSIDYKSGRDPHLFVEFASALLVGMNLSG